MDGAPSRRRRAGARHRGHAGGRSSPTLAQLDVGVPLVVMTYYNPVRHMGHERFAAALADAGIAGAIVPDLPLDELDGWADAADARRRRDRAARRADHPRRPAARDLRAVPRLRLRRVADGRHRGADRAGVSRRARDGRAAARPPPTSRCCSASASRTPEQAVEAAAVRRRRDRRERPRRPAAAGRRPRGGARVRRASSAPPSTTARAAVDAPRDQVPRVQAAAGPGAGAPLRGGRRRAPRSTSSPAPPASRRRSSARGAHVTAVDTARYSEVFAQCYIATDATAVDLDELGRRRRRPRTSLPGEPGLLHRDVLRAVAVLPAVQRRAHRRHPRRDRTRLRRVGRCYPILLTSLIEAADRVDSTTGVQMAYVKQWAPRSYRPLELRVPSCSPAPGRAVRGDASRSRRRCRRSTSPTRPALQPAPLLHELPRVGDAGGVGRARSTTASRASASTPATDDRRACSTAGAHARRAPAGRRRGAAPGCVVLSYNDESWVEPDELRDMCAVRGHVEVLAFDSRRYVGAQIGIHNPQRRAVGTVSHVRNREYVVIGGERDEVRRLGRRPAGGAASVPDVADRGRAFEKVDGCDLCEAARITPWFHEDDVCWIAECEICYVPMVVWRLHGTEPPAEHLAHMHARAGPGGRRDADRRALRRRQHAQHPRPLPRPRAPEGRILRARLPTSVDVGDHVEPARTATSWRRPALV